MWKVYAACEICLLIAVADDRVLCHLIMFQPSFCTGSTKWNTSAIKILLLFLAGLFIGLWLRNAPNDKKKSEIVVFKNKLLLVSLLRLAGWVRRSKSLNRFLPYLMSFRAASRPVSFSNYITFHVFFLVSWSRALFMPSFFTHFIRFETMIWPTI